MNTTAARLWIISATVSAQKRWAQVIQAKGKADISPALIDPSGSLTDIFWPGVQKPSSISESPMFCFSRGEYMPEVIAPIC